MSQRKKILIFEDEYRLTNYLMEYWIELSRQCIEATGKFTAAVSGGKTPVSFYSKLAGFRDFETWKRTYLFWTDERYVPADDRQSNYLLVKNTLINDVDIPQDNIFAVPTDYKYATLAADKYDSMLKDFFALSGGQFPKFDLMLLGMGTDGHTASLFPGDTALDETEKWVTSVVSQEINPKRITLTLPVINHARKIIFLIMGEQKAHLLAEILHEGKDYPASRVKAIDGEIIYFLDQKAAKELNYLDSYEHDREAIVMYV